MWYSQFSQNSKIITGFSMAFQFQWPHQWNEGRETIPIRSSRRFSIRGDDDGSSWRSEACTERQTTTRHERQTARVSHGNAFLIIEHAKWLTMYRSYKLTFRFNFCCCCNNMKIEYLKLFIFPSSNLTQWLFFLCI